MLIKDLHNFNLQFLVLLIRDFWIISTLALVGLLSLNIAICQNP